MEQNSLVGPLILRDPITDQLSRPFSVEHSNNVFPQELYGGSEEKQGSKIIYASTIASQQEGIGKVETMVFVDRPELISHGNGGLLLKIRIRLSAYFRRPMSSTKFDEFNFEICGKGFGETGFFSGRCLRSDFSACVQGGKVYRKEILGDGWGGGYDAIMTELTKFAACHPEINFEKISRIAENIVQELLHLPEIIALQTQCGIAAIGLFREGEIGKDLKAHGVDAVGPYKAEQERLKLKAQKAELPSDLPVFINDMLVTKTD